MGASFIIDSLIINENLMKNLFWIITISLITLFWIAQLSHAGDHEYTQQQGYYTPNYEPELEYEVEGNYIYFEWDEAENDEFRYYKLVHSESNSQPIYPNQKTMFVGKLWQEETKTKYKKGYWRVCHVHKWYYEQWEDTKYSTCSNVVYLSEEIKKDSDDKYKDKKEYAEKKYIEKTNEAKKTYLKKKTTLSLNTQKRANTIISNFKKKLDTSSLSNVNKIKKINSIIAKLQTISKSKPQLKTLITYLVIKLETVRESYQDDFEDIEGLFDF